MENRYKKTTTCISYNDKTSKVIQLDIKLKFEKDICEGLKKEYITLFSSNRNNKQMIIFIS
jgi:hypothetical protein